MKKLCFYLLAIVLTIAASCSCDVKKFQFKPRCNPGEQAVKATCMECKGSGFLQKYNCVHCQGRGLVPKYVGTNPYTQVNIYKLEKCLDCCGCGKMLHQLCSGWGWRWECRPIP